jgi:hypothetical protein
MFFLHARRVRAFEPAYFYFSSPDTPLMPS